VGYNRPKGFLSLMRTRLNYSWTGLSLRATTLLFFLAGGFAAAMLQKVLNTALWPGNHAALGFALFLLLGGLLGLSLPELRAAATPLLQLQVRGEGAGRRPGQFQTAQTALTLCGLLLIVVAIVCSAATSLIADSPLYWSDRLALTRWSWPLLAMLLAGLPAWPLGVCLGLLVQLVYSGFVRLHCPTGLQASHPRVQHVLASAIAWMLAGLVAGFLLGNLSADRWFVRWHVLVLVPCLGWLAGMLPALARKTAAVPAQPDATEDQLPRPVSANLPEVATAPSQTALLAAGVLGWLGLWQAYHWHFALTNWFRDPPMATRTMLLAVLLGPLAVMAGRFLHRHLCSRIAPLRLTPIDRQGLSLAVLALVNLICLPLTVAADASPATTQLLLLLMLAIYVLCIECALPALALGRTSRFDLWSVLAKALAFGAVLAIGSLIVWHRTSTGNLAALALGSIIAIAAAGVALIYDEPHVRVRRLAPPTATAMNAATFLSLYAVLVAVVLVTPKLKPYWLRGQALAAAETHSGSAFVHEGPQGLVISTPELTFTGRNGGVLGEESLHLARLLIEPLEISRAARVLLVGFPCPAGQDDGSPLAMCIQTDFQVAAARLACSWTSTSTADTTAPASKPAGPDDPESLTNYRKLDRLDLRILRDRYDTVVVLLPTPRRPATWPKIALTLQKTIRLAGDVDRLYFILPGNYGPANGAVQAALAAAVPDQGLMRLDISGQSGDWTILGTHRGIESAATKLLMVSDPYFTRR